MRLAALALLVAGLGVAVQFGPAIAAGASTGGRVVRFRQESIDADRDGMFERLLLSVELDLPRTHESWLAVSMREPGDSDGVEGTRVRRVGEYSVADPVPVGASSAGRRSFRLQFDGEEIRRRLNRREACLLTIQLFDSIGIVATWRVRSSVIDPARFGWRSAHVTHVEEIAHGEGRELRIDLAVHRRDHARLEASIVAGDTLWEGSRVVELAPGDTMFSLVVLPSKGAKPALLSGTSGLVHVWDDDLYSDYRCVETYWYRRGQEWVDSSRPRKFP